jgi:multidrug resistance efflux pump
VVSEDELEEAAINRETAQQKVELLTRIAQSALDLAMAEHASATTDAARLRQLRQANALPQSQVDQAEAQVAAARAKIKMLETVLGASTPRAESHQQ